MSNVRSDSSLSYYLRKIFLKLTKGQYELNFISKGYNKDDVSLS
jgi:hypothetical protein